jgi:hypothetical protein
MSTANPLSSVQSADNANRAVVLYLDSCATEVSITNASIGIVNWGTTGLMIQFTAITADSSVVKYYNRCNRSYYHYAVIRSVGDTSVYIRSIN